MATSSAKIQPDSINPFVVGEVPVNFKASTPIDAPLPLDQELLMILIGVGEAHAGIAGNTAAAYVRVSELQQDLIELNGAFVSPETFSQADCPTLRLRSPVPTPRFRPESSPVGDET